MSKLTKLSMLTATAISAVLVALPATAQSALSESLGGNWRMTVDLSGGADVSGGHVTFLNTVGFDTHKVVSSPSGDWATVVMQGYLTRADHTAEGKPDDASFMFRIFNANITRFGRGHFNVRVGHFEVPFGLEHVINTNGTLRDFMHGHNIGVKADWGVGLNGSWRKGEYEVTWSRGTETSLSASGGSYLFAGRVGMPSDGNLVLGVSALRGRVRNLRATAEWRADVGPEAIEPEAMPLVDEAVAAGVIDRYRVGADVAWYRGVYGVLAESAYGEDSGPDGVARRTVVNALAEVNRTNSDDRVLTYFQGRLFSHETAAGWSRQVNGALGIRFAVDRHWSVSAEYSQRLPGSDRAQERALRLQLRHRF